MTTPLVWLTYSHKGKVVVAIVPASTCLSARLKASLEGMIDSEFQEGHVLSEKLAKKVPEAMIGRALSAKEATALLKKMEG